MSEKLELGREDILRLFGLLNDDLGERSLRGELYVTGGAVMCLVFEARPSTRDVDAVFHPASELRRAAARVAAQAGVREDWLNDGVKGFLSSRGQFDPYLQLSNLSVFTARADYLLAMKCAAMRIGAGFRDEGDVRFLLRALGITRYDDAVSIVTRYFDAEQLPQKTWYALEEILAEAVED